MAEFDDVRALLERNIQQFEFDQLIDQMLRDARARLGFREETPEFRQAFGQVRNELVGPRTGLGLREAQAEADRAALAGLQRPLSDREIEQQIAGLRRPEPTIGQRQVTRFDPTIGDRRVVREGTIAPNPDFDRQQREFDQAVADIRARGSVSLPDVTPRESAFTGGTISTRQQARDQLRPGQLRRLIEERAGENAITANRQAIEDFTARPEFQLNIGEFDPMIEEILGRRRALADAAVQSRFRHGDLNRRGVELAGEELGRQRLGAQSLLGERAGGILAEGRQSIDDFIANAIAEAGTRNFDLGGFQTGFGDIVSRTRGGLEGALLNAIGGEQFFRPNEAVTRAGQLIGPIRNQFDPGRVV